MFKVGQTYKVKLSLETDSSGIGRATIVGMDSRYLYFRLRNSEGKRTELSRGAKIWFVGASADNRFNGLWYSEVSGNRIINGISAMECRMPRFQQQSQSRAKERLETSLPLKIQGGEWRNLKEPIEATEISRTGMSLRLCGNWVSFFPEGRLLVLNLNDQKHKFNLDLTVKVINARWNWLDKQSEIGVEFDQLGSEPAAALEQYLSDLSGRMLSDRFSTTGSGSLLRWVKAEKGERKLLKSQSTVKTANSGEEPESDKRADHDLTTYPDLRAEANEQAAENCTAESKPTEQEPEQRRELPEKADQAEENS